MTLWKLLMELRVRKFKSFNLYAAKNCCICKCRLFKTMFIRYIYEVKPGDGGIELCVCMNCADHKDYDGIINSMIEEGRYADRIRSKSGL